MSFDLKKFLSDPAHKEGRDFLSGFVDHRIKEIVEERMKQKENEDDDKDEDDEKKDKRFASFFDEIFFGSKKKS